MRKFLLAVFLAVLLSASSYGATSEDMSVYVRQDVFDAKMEALFTRLDAKIGELKNELKSEISGFRTELKSEISELRGDIKALSSRIDGLEKRVEDTHTYAYWFIIIFLAMLALPFVNRLLEKYEERKSTVTLEDVKRLIAEAQLGNAPRA